MNAAMRLTWAVVSRTGLPPHAARCLPGESNQLRLDLYNSSDPALSERDGRWLVAPAAPQGGVGALGGDQVGVGAELGDAAVLDHRDPVGVVGGVEAVGDRDHGPAGQDRRQGTLQVAG